MTILDYMIKRRKEAREKYRRLIHPEPILSDVREQVKISNIVKGDRLKIALSRGGDLIVETLKDLRTIETWSGILSDIISINLVTPIIEKVLEPIFPKRK